MTLALVAVLCFTVGLVGCNKDKGSTAGKNPRIIIETDSDELVLEVGTQYTLPYAGVYDENLDRIDGKEITMSVKNIGISNEEKAYLVKDTLDNVTLRFLTKGTYHVIYSAEGVPDAIIVVYACRKLDKPTNFTVEGNTLTWDAVENAQGYKVTVNGGEEVIVSGRSFQSEVFNKTGYYVGVTAIGDNKNYIDSVMGSYRNRIPLVYNSDNTQAGYGAGELASFNDPNYELDIDEGFPQNINPVPSEIKWFSEEECAGSTGGALKLLVKSGAYAFGNFRILLERGFDSSREKVQTGVNSDGEPTYSYPKVENPLEKGRYDIDGLEVRFKLISKDYQDNSTRLSLSRPEKEDIQFKNSLMLDRNLDGAWQILKVPVESLHSEYVGQEYIQFNLYSMVRTLGKGELYFDYIRLYDGELSAPTNLALENNKFTFDAVEGASKYEVYVSQLKNEQVITKSYTVNANEVPFADIGLSDLPANAQFEIKVRAVSADPTVGSSEWSTESAIQREIPSGNVISAMDSGFYAKDFAKSYSFSTWQGATNVAHVTETSYVDVAGADGGKAVKVTLVNDGWSSSFFKVNLPKALDFTAYDTIVVRFMVESNDASVYSLGLQLIGPTSDSQNYTTTYFRKEATLGQWLELAITVDEQTYYNSGDKALCFAFKNLNSEAKQTKTIAYFDYIKGLNAIAEPTNLEVSKQGLVTWTAVDGAAKYIVDVEGVQTEVTTTSYQITELTKDATVKVIAVPTDTATKCNSKPATGSYVYDDPNVLIGFNTDSDLDNVVPYNPNVLSQYGSDNYDKRFYTGFSPIIKAVGDAKGVNFATYVTRYDKWINGGSKMQKCAVFSINTDKGLDLTGKTGIKIRFQLNSLTEYSATEKLFFTMYGAESKTDNYAITVENSSFAYVQVTERNAWFELTVTNAQLEALGYANGDTSFVFGLQRENGVHYNNYNAQFTIDSVVYVA